MTLDEHITSLGRGGLTKMAKALETSKGYLSDVRKGKAGCSVDFARKIESVTNGKVRAAVVLGLESEGAA